MKVYLNEITGMADALVSMYMSKRTWTPECSVGHMDGLIGSGDEHEDKS